MAAMATTAPLNPSALTGTGAAIIGSLAGGGAVRAGDHASFRSSGRIPPCQSATPASFPISLR